MTRYIICMNDVPIEAMTANATQEHAHERCRQLKAAWEERRARGEVSMMVNYWSVDVPMWDHNRQAYR